MGVVQPARFWLFPDNRTVVLIRTGDSYAPPESDRVGVDTISLAPGIHAAVSNDVTNGVDGGTVVERRAALDLLDHDLYHEMNRAFHIAHWHAGSQYCGRCGAKTEISTTEMAKVCTGCGTTTYPRVSPAAIMAVVRDGKLLMAHSKRFPDGMYSILAGFVEPGENLEQCVAREVFEETGITVRNVEYFASQPWSFPESLMMGFTAEWASGEIEPDHDEIEDAGWFGPNDLPETIPTRHSISRRLIEWYVSEYGSANSLRRVMERP